MQITHLPGNVHRLAAYATRQDALAAHRARIEPTIRLWEQLRAKGLSAADCAETIGISRATYYRGRARLAALNRGEPPSSRAPIRRNKPQWGEAEKQLVLGIRRDNPTWGRFKIAIVIRRDYDLNISESTVGRIITHLKEKGLVQRSRAYIRKRKRNFARGHARRWTKKERDKLKLGERIQIDHMSATKNGVSVKTFVAWEPKSRHIEAEIYSNAKASSARKFLLGLIEKAPYKVLSVQVDGGSEFMAEFEDECEKLKLPLEVLPPSSPKLNGGVERTNRTLREDFFRDARVRADSIGALRYDLRKHVERHNTYRPHRGLNGMTPMEYINLTRRKAA